MVLRIAPDAQRRDYDNRVGACVPMSGSFPSGKSSQTAAHALDSEVPDLSQLRMTHKMHDTQQLCVVARRRSLSQMSSAPADER
jgi:hypothetical protein